jgi:hypothetical protein
MSATNDTTGKRPLAEPATEQSGNEVGGMRVGADHGFSDPTQRSMEHADTSPLGRASIGDHGEPRLDLGGTNEPGAAATPTNPHERPTADQRAAPASSATLAAGKRANAGPAKDDEDDEWRHPPIAPVDEGNPLKSLGRAIADVATSSSGPAPKPRDR